MNEAAEKILDRLIDEQTVEIPPYAITVSDYIETIKKKTGEEIPWRTACDRMHKLVFAGKLVKIKIRQNLCYYVPIELAKNAEIDPKAIMGHD